MKETAHKATISRYIYSVLTVKTDGSIVLSACLGAWFWGFMTMTLVKEKLPIPFERLSDDSLPRSEL
jgi:hypothetical protein